LKSQALTRPFATHGAARASSVAVAGAVLALVLAGCGSAAGRAPRGAQMIPPALLHQARPIGRGPRFRPRPSFAPLHGCRKRLGKRTAVHVELFAAGRVVLIPAAIGTRPPLRLVDGRVVGARCYGPIVTLNDTGVVLSNSPDARLGELFWAWREPLGRRRLLSFRGRVRAYVNGRRWRKAPASIRLRADAEIVLEVGPYVPPHRSFAFEPQP
jgi:hypothetical protein